MFIELSEFLRCPEPHEETFCVVAPDEMSGRSIVRGVVGCPICKREYPIEGGVVRFGARGAGGAGGAEGAEGAVPPEPDAVWALLGLTTPGGFVVLVGSAARLAAPLAERLGGVHFVGINAPEESEAGPGLSLLVHPDLIPLQQAMARGAVLGREVAAQPWTGEGARVLLPGLRLVAVAQTLSAPGLEQLAAGNGLWVGQKARKGGTGKGEARSSRGERTTDNG